MFLKNEDIHLMIKMENVIGMNKNRIFGKDGTKTVYVDGLEINYHDFIAYLNLIDRILENKKKLSAKSNAYNKAHPEKHREINRRYEERKRNKKGGEL